MSMVAIVPVANLAAANSTLASAGFGPNNFSVPAYTGRAATHAALHAWTDAAFQTAVQAITGVVVEISTGDPVTRTKALIELQGAVWGDQVPELPTTGNLTAGSLYRHDGSLWSVIQTFNRATFSASPETYLALIRRVRNRKVTEEWSQPNDQFDSYNLVNPFTGMADRCTKDGKTYATKLNANVWEPPSAQWQEIDPVTGEDVVPPVSPWVQPTGANPYPMGAIVTHNGKTWENTGSAANVWEPGVVGWTDITVGTP